MMTRERELIVGALRIRRDLVAMMMRNEAPCYKTRDELQALWQELKTLADRIESGQWERDVTPLTYQGPQFGLSEDGSHDS